MTFRTLPVFTSILIILFGDFHKQSGAIPALNPGGPIRVRREIGSNQPLPSSTQAPDPLKLLEEAEFESKFRHQNEMHDSGKPAAPGIPILSDLKLPLSKLKHATSHIENRLTVFDCTDPNSSHTALDLHTPAMCDVQKSQYEAGVNITIQAIAAGNKLTVEGYSCLLTVSTTIHKCGFTSISYGYLPGVIDQMVELTPKECRDAYRTKVFVYKSNVFPVNEHAASYKSWFSEGDLTKNHYCTSASFRRGDTFHTNSYEITVGRFELKPHKGEYSPSSGRVTFDNGLVANYRDQVIKDNSFGVLCWEVDDIVCESKLSNIYVGPALLYKRKVNRLAVPEPSDLILIANDDEDRYAGFVVKGNGLACDVSVLLTQLPEVQLLVLNENEREIQIPFNPNHDVEKNQADSGNGFLHLRQSMHIDQRFVTMTELICENEKSHLSTILAMLSDHNPYALLSKYGEGYLISRMGSAAYLSYCVPKVARLRQFPNCTQEIPVTVGNRQLFADSLTRILQPFPTITTCDGITPIRWRLSGSGDDAVWVCSNPKLTPCLAPGQLDPISDDLQFGNHHDFTEGMQKGMYTAAQEEEHVQHVLSLMTRAPIATRLNNDLLYRLLNDPSQHGLGDITLYGSKEIATIRDQVGQMLIPFYHLVGSWWSTIMGILVIITLVKTFIGALVRMYCTYLEKGCGLWVLAAAFDTVFMILSLPIHIVVSAATQAAGPLLFRRFGRRHRRNDDDDDNRGNGDGSAALQNPLISRNGLEMTSRPTSPTGSPKASAPPLEEKSDPSGETGEASKSSVDSVYRKARKELKSLTGDMRYNGLLTQMDTLQTSNSRIENRVNTLLDKVGLSPNDMATVAASVGAAGAAAVTTNLLNANSTTTDTTAGATNQPSGGPNTDNHGQQPKTQ